MALALGRPVPELAPGRMSALTATVGPNRTDAVIRLRVTGELGGGLLYRAVTGPGGRRCAVVRTARFACRIDLPPRARAALRLWVTPDAVRAPTLARQRLRVRASEPAVEVSVSWSRPVPTAHSRTVRSGVAALARETSTAPGALVPLLALLLLALAAETARRPRNRRTPRRPPCP